MSSEAKTVETKIVRCGRCYSQIQKYSPTIFNCECCKDFTLAIECSLEFGDGTKSLCEGKTCEGSHTWFE